MSDVKLCPVCNGRGIVRSDFYTIQVTSWNTVTVSEPDNQPITCRACNGKGIIFVPDYLSNTFEPTVTCNSTQVKDVDYLNRPHVSDNPDNY